MRTPWLMLGVSWLLLGGMTDAAPERSPQLDRLRHLYANLTLDSPLDRAKLDRLRAAALEDDLIVDAREQALMEGFIAKGYQDPTGESAPETLPTFEGKAPKGWVARAQKLLIASLHAGLLSRTGAQSLRELTAIAWRDDLTADDRQQILDLIDNYRAVETKERSQDVLEGLSVLVANPQEAKSDRDHHRQLEALEKLTNRPLIHWSPQASPSR